MVTGEILGAVEVFLALFQMLWIPWSTGETTYFSIGGYLPWSDASWWFNGGLHLLLDGKLNGLSATRIVNEVFFAALLGISGQHLQFVLILRTVLIAVATFLFVREVAHRLGHHNSQRSVRSPDDILQASLRSGDPSSRSKTADDLKFQIRPAAEPANESQRGEIFNGAIQNEVFGRHSEAVVAFVQRDAGFADAIAYI